MRPLAPEGIEPYAPGFLENPWPRYRRLHEAGAILWHPKLGAWLVSGHAEALEVLRDESYYARPHGESLAQLGKRAGRDFSSLAEVLGAVPFFNNPPQHAALRRYVAGVLTAQAIAAYVPAIRRIARELLEKARARRRFDAVVDYADRLPPLFMAWLLGIPHEKLPEILSLTSGVIRIFNRVLRFPEYEDCERRVAQVLAFFRALVAERRRGPRDDGLSRMIAARHEGNSLDDAGVARIGLVIFLVGIETTSTLIGTALRALFDDPARLEELRREPALLEPAPDEFLRLDSPVQNTLRIATRDGEIGGQRIAQGERLLLMLGACNRDPRAWREPDRLDFRRAGPPHLAFAEGAHYCLGATLARTETRIALEAFLELPPCRRASASDNWWPYDWMRRLRELPVEFA